MPNANQVPLTTAGLILAVIIAGTAFLLSRWENFRPKWSNEGALDKLSYQVRRIGIRLIWLESLLLAIGSQIPTELRQDRLLFVTIWAIIGFLAIILLTIALFDALVRFVAHRIRATALQQVMKTHLENQNQDNDDFNEID
ncbi:MAG: hypothetical protein ACKO85_04685 [Isosphaeraceae bacterium]